MPALKWLVGNGGIAATVADMEPPGRVVGPRVFDAVLFDVDDTLYAVTDLVTAVCRQHSGALAGYGIDAELLCSAYGAACTGLPYRPALAEALARAGAAHVHVDVLCRIVESSVPPRLPARPGTRELLAELRAAGVATGAVTNGDPARQHAKVAALGLEDLLDVVIYAGGDVPAKPHRQPFLLAASALGLPPERILFVGDRPDVDVAPAVALGMGAIRLVAGHHAALPAHPDSLLETGDPAVVWASVRQLAGTRLQPQLDRVPA